MDVNTSKLQNKLRLMARARPEGRKNAVRFGVGAAMRGIVAGCPRDTNRLVNGFIEAGQQATLGAFVGSLLPLKQSKYRGLQETALAVQVSRYEKNVKYWAGQVAFLRNAKALDGGKRVLHRRGGDVTVAVALREAEAALRKNIKLVDRAKAEQGKLAQFSIVFGIFGGRSGRKIGTTVSSTVYGGQGEFIHTADASYVRIRNMEPHARIIEKRTGLVRKAVAALKTDGIETVKRGYVDSMRAAAGVSP